MLSIYSTLTREQRPFEPIEPGRVRMYVCGVTVYDYCHIGHGRTFVAFDVVRRCHDRRAHGRVRPRDAGGHARPRVPRADS